MDHVSWFSAFCYFCHEDKRDCIHPSIHYHSLRVLFLLKTLNSPRRVAEGDQTLASASRRRRPNSKLEKVPLPSANFAYASDNSSQHGKSQSSRRGYHQDINIQSRETVNITRMDYLFTQFRVIITYLRLLIFPINQSIDYNYPIYDSFFEPNVFLSFLLLLSILGIGVYLFYRSRRTVHSSQALNSELLTLNSRLISFGIFWFFITLSVESSVIPIKDIIFEHRLYLPSIGFFIASVSVMEYFIRQKKVKIFAIIIVVTALSVAAFNRNLIWNDPQALWENVLVKFPNNVRAYNGLGVIFKEQEEYDKALIRLKEC